MPGTDGGIGKDDIFFLKTTYIRKIRGESGIEFMLYVSGAECGAVWDVLCVGDMFWMLDVADGVGYVADCSACE